jgi:hypothetical protein
LVIFIGIAIPLFGFFVKDKEIDIKFGLASNPSNDKNNQQDLTSQIEKLSELKNKNIISEEEFENKKKELLSKI